MDKMSSNSMAIRNLNGETLAQLVLPIDSRDQQELIADFLDRESSRIDALVEAKRKLIDLLAEKRTAVITHAVTAGLGDLRLKSVPGQWIESVPTHWNLVPFRRLCELHRGYDLPKDVRATGIHPLISSAGFIGHVSEARAVGPGIATGRYGSVGAVHWVDADYWPLNTTLYSRRFHFGEPRYVYYMLQVLPIAAETGKSAVPGISRQDIHPMMCPLPPREEQIAIAHYLDLRISLMDSLGMLVARQLTLLAEYRQALITAAVTGQLDEATLRGHKPADEAMEFEVPV
jgi:type I restriction enzyme S subunit